MDFREYCSIDNAYRQKTVDEIVSNGFAGGEWVVEEKVHGSNFSIYYDGVDLRCAKKSSFIGENENFYGCQAVVERCRENVKCLWDYLKASKPDLKFMVLCGEIFGGSYPHPDVPKVPNVTKVQNGIWYTANDEFYVYDMKLDGEGYMNVRDRNNLLAQFGFFYARPLFYGTFKECLEYPNKYQTNIPTWLGLPAIEDNICEGNVLKPVEAKFFACGSRVILKNKNEKWSEKAKTPRIKEEIVLSERGTSIYNQLFELVTENRLRNVISHVGQITDKEFGKLLGLYCVDLWDEFNKDNAEIFAGMDKKEEQKIKKTIGKDVANLIREHFVNIVDGNF